MLIDDLRSFARDMRGVKTESVKQLLLDAAEALEIAYAALAVPAQAAAIPITDAMVEAGAQALAPEVWATDCGTFGHPDSLNRRGHEHCKNMVRGQARACLISALSSTDRGGK